MSDMSVLDLLEDFGQDLTIARSTTTGYNPATGTVTTGSATTFTVRGVFIYFQQEDIDGTVVQTGDRRLLITAEGAGGTPQTHDTVDGHRILAVRTFAPSGTVVAWDCHVRK